MRESSSSEGGVPAGAHLQASSACLLHVTGAAPHAATKRGHMVSGQSGPVWSHGAAQAAASASQEQDLSNREGPVLQRRQRWASLTEKGVSNLGADDPRARPYPKPLTLTPNH